MKRIEVAYPFEAARGALGGRQKLVYNDHNNPAFDAPLGRQYAKNYRKQMIASKRASDGLNYFQIKSRSAVNNTVQGLVRQAAFAVANFMYAQVLNDKTVGGLLDRMQQALADTIERGYLPADTTLRQHFVGEVYKKLIAHDISFGFGMAWDGHSSVIFFKNPYYLGTTQQSWVDIKMPADLLVKFWEQLAVHESGILPIKFKIDGATGVSFVGLDWQTLASTEAEDINILNVGVENGAAEPYYVYVGSASASPRKYLQLGTTYQEADMLITAGAKYTTTTVVPA